MLLLWSKESKSWAWEHLEKTGDDLSRINLELFIERTATLYKVEIRIRALTNEGGQRIGIIWFKVTVHHAQNCEKCVITKDYVSTFVEMRCTGM